MDGFFCLALPWGVVRRGTRQQQAGIELSIELVRVARTFRRPDDPDTTPNIQAQLLAAEIHAEFWRRVAVDGGLPPTDLATIRRMACAAAEGLASVLDATIH